MGGRESNGHISCVHSCSQAEVDNVLWCFSQGCPYLPPEAAQAPCTTATDIFSFGKLLLYTILQELPENTSSLLADASFPKLPVQQQTQAIEQVSQLPRDEGHTHPVERLVDWCLQKEAGNRPAASQVLDVLTKGWAEVECPYEQITKMKLAVTTKLLEQSLINQFQDAASANQVDTQVIANDIAHGAIHWFVKHVSYHNWSHDCHVQYVFVPVAE